MSQVIYSALLQPYHCSNKCIASCGTSSWVFTTQDLSTPRIGGPPGRAGALDRSELAHDHFIRVWYALLNIDSLPCT